VLFFSFDYIRLSKHRDDADCTYPYEVVIDVKEDTLFNHKYAVKIKQVERLEQVYWYHTNKKMNIGDTVKTNL
jgi:hypothetical protein